MCTCARAVSFARFYFLTERTLCFGAVYRSTLMLERWKIKFPERIFQMAKADLVPVKLGFIVFPDIEFILPKLNTISFITINYNN